MRFTTIALLVAANSLRPAAAEESPSASVTDVPECALPAFKNALEKAGCDTKDFGTATFDCLCKQVTGISESMALSAAGSELDTDCLEKWGSAVQTVCGYWSAVSTSASDFPEATKALGSELGSSGGASSGVMSTASSVSGTSTTTSSKGAGPTPTASPSKAATTSPSKAPAATATPAALVIGAAALAGLLA